MPQGQRLSVLLQRARRRHSGRRSLAAAAADAMVEGCERKGGDGSRSPRACGSAIAREPILKGRADAVLQQVKPPGGAAAISLAKLPSPKSSSQRTLRGRDGFELLVPRHESPRFRKHPGAIAAEIV